MKEFDVPVSISRSLVDSVEMGYLAPSNELSKFRSAATAYISAEIQHPPRPKTPSTSVSRYSNGSQGDKGITAMPQEVCDRVALLGPTYLRGAILMFIGNPLAV